MKIPNQLFQLSKLISKRDYYIRIVGGYIRDYLTGNENHEIDVATTMPAEDLMNVCESNGYKVIPTGLKHGTITVIIKGMQFEITTLRKDVECDGRHASVFFTDNWREDAMRRDFTINAMYADMQGRIYDYFNGQEDLKCKIVKFIGDPIQRIEEDYLRIMRYFRFLGYFRYDEFDVPLHPASIDAAVKLSKHLDKISADRIRVELLKTLSSKSPSIPIRLMLENGVFENIGLGLYPDIAINDLYLIGDGLINLAALMRKSGLSNVQSLKQLKFSNNEQKKIAQLLTIDFQGDFDFIIKSIIKGSDITAFINNRMQELGKSTVIELFNFYFVMHAKSTIANENLEYLLDLANHILNSISLKDLPVDGNDLIKLGLTGPTIGNCLTLLKQKWIESDCSLSKEELLETINNKS